MRKNEHLPIERIPKVFVDERSQIAAKGRRWRGLFSKRAEDITTFPWKRIFREHSGKL